MLLAKDFIILRGVKASGCVSHPLNRKPVRVATMLDEAKFNEHGHGLIHMKTVFLEDELHDWTWDKGRFRYFTRVADVADVLVVFELDEVFFCTQCGAQKSSLSAECPTCSAGTN
ncbi:TPA: hypothetical protein L6A07_25005 [Pseudomonas aeruginosa]|nr:hypothetical protein [Pseudomonas aeruginosa]